MRRFIGEFEVDSIRSPFLVFCAQIGRVAVQQAQWPARAHRSLRPLKKAKSNAASSFRNRSAGIDNWLGSDGNLPGARAFCVR